MLHGKLLAHALAALSITLAAGSVPQAQDFDLNGQWRLRFETIQVKGICEDELAEVYVEEGVTITQSGSTVTVDVPGIAGVFTGTLAGDQLDVSGCFPDDGGTTCIVQTTLTVTNCTLSGTSGWTWSDETFFCLGTDEVIGERTSPCIDVAGACPGPIDLDVSGNSPFANIVLAFSDTPGAFSVQSGACPGITVGLVSPQPLLIGYLGDSGSASTTLEVPLEACGLYLQVVDLSTCTVSNVVQL